MSDIRGLVIQSRLDYMEKFTDGNVYQHVMQKLSDPVRQAIGEQVFPTNLYPFYLLQDLDEALGESINKPLESIFREMGKYYAKIMLDRYFFNYIDSQNPQKFLAQIYHLYPYLWNFGKYEYKKTGESSAFLKFEYDEDIYKAYCWFIQEFLLEGIRLCGGGAAKITENECEAEDGESCVYEVHW